MIKNINIRFNLDKEEHKKAWNYMQKMDRLVEKSYSKVIIRSLIWYFENASIKDKVEMSETYWERFRIEMEKLLKEQVALSPLETESFLKEPKNKKLAETENDCMPKISEDVLDILEDLF